MVKVSGLYKSFKTKKGKQDVLKNVDFTAYPGEIYGLLGPNGAGKTTTLRTIVTLLKPDKGYTEVMGLNSQKDSRKVRDSVGFLTGDMKLSGNLSPRMLLKFFGQLNHIENNIIEQRITELSNYLDMNTFLDKPIEKCSTGMKQKASIAVSLIHDPDVIIFDEPTNGLDILASKIVIDFLFDYKKKGKTVILSTHIMSEAEKLCDRVGILLNGELVENGVKEELLKKYNTQNLEDIFFDLAKGKGLLENA
jgi:sodium transport system ATP-binding protein